MATVTHAQTLLAQEPLGLARHTHSKAPVTAAPQAMPVE